MDSVREGGCQCGALRYRVTGEPVAVGICHCRECQRQSGSAFGMSLYVREAGFALLSGRPKTFTRNSDSGRPVVCAFCQDCGTRIYHEAQWLSTDVINIKPGTLDDPSFLRPVAESWTVRRQNWLPPFAGLRAFETQPSGQQPTLGNTTST